MNESIPPQAPEPQKHEGVAVDAPETPAAEHPSGLSHDERLWATFTHLSALLGGLLTSWFAGLGIFIGPLIVWLIKRDTMPFVDDQGKEALNFSITVALASLALVLLTLLTLGVGLLLTLPLGIALAIFWLVFTIIATIRANEGVRYRYPINLRLIR